MFTTFFTWKINLLTKSDTTLYLNTNVSLQGETKVIIPMKQIVTLCWTIPFVPPCIWCILQKILKIVKWFHKRHLPYFSGNLALMRQFSIIVCTNKNLVFCQSCFSLESVISLARSLRDTFAPNTMRDCQNHCNNISFGTAKKRGLRALLLSSSSSPRRPPIFERISFHERLLKCAVKKKKEAWVLNGP